MSPEKIAIAVAVTMAAIAGTGAMKNVTGTSSAVAMVAVSPGTAPTKRPNSDATSITTRLYGSNTIANAWTHALLMTANPSPLSRRLPRDALQKAPGERDLQQLVERVVDAQRHHERERDDPSRPDLEHREKHREVDDAGRR